MSEPTVIWCDASHYRLVGGEVRSVAGIAVCDAAGRVLATRLLEGVGSNAAERQAVALGLEVAGGLPGPVELRCDSQGAVSGFRDARAARVVWRRRTHNTANAEARRQLRRRVDELLAVGYRLDNGERDLYPVLAPV